MAVTISTGTLSQRGGWVGQTSGGTKVALFHSPSFAGIKAYRNIDGTPSQIGSEQTASTILGAGAADLRFHACIDSADTIHVFALGSSASTNDLMYATISDPDGTPSWSSWTQIQAFDQGNSATYGSLACSISSGVLPCVVYTDQSKDKGTNFTRVWFTEYIGSPIDAWQTPVQLSSNNGNNYRLPAVSYGPSGTIEVMYHNSTGALVAYQTRNSGGTWSGESTYAGGASALIYLQNITVTTGGTVYRYYTRANVIYENDVSIANSFNASGAAVWLLPSTGARFVAYGENDVADGRDINMRVNRGAGWSEKEALAMAGSVANVCTGWQYHHQNNITTVDFLGGDGTNVYWEEYPAVYGIVPQPLLSSVMRMRNDSRLRR